MKYKRLELYVWWTCNQKCTYCMEFPNMDENWNNKVTTSSILKDLIKYKDKWYNHVTYLWWEPFIQPVFLDALKLWKKLWYTILVTTNATTLHLDSQAKKFLPYIDELILSVEAIDKELQQVISRTNVFVEWEKVFHNIDKYWKWKYLKANIVITKDNLEELFFLVKYISNKWVNNISITYPDLDLKYYWLDHLKKNVAPTYKDAIKKVEKIEYYCNINNIHLKIVDFPFCVFPKNNIQNYIDKTDEIDYWNRLKIWDVKIKGKKFFNYELNRFEIIPRKRRLISKCNSCIYNNLCWWPSVNYKSLYWYKEINPIKNDK